MNTGIMGLNRRNRIAKHIKEELRTAGFHIRRRHCWLAGSQITERIETIRVGKEVA